MAELALRTIRDGVIIIDKDCVVRYINLAATFLTGLDRPENALGLDFLLIMKLETADGTKVADEANELLQAARSNQAFASRKYVLVAEKIDRKTPVAVSLTPSGDAKSDRIITFRDISEELKEEGSQMEFISTASHEMRTPVASIEGYLGLALNPQTATIDSRARQYLESAHSASQRLGNLFKDLLDVTKLEDHRLKVRPVPVELTGFVKKFADEYLPKFSEKRISYSFGAGANVDKRYLGRVVSQMVYTSVDVDFLGEILANLIENAIKYTPEGGAVWISVQGDGDRALINVTDSGIGISAEDLQHIFQKFYRADNSQTRTVGGTGLGLYLVKQRVEAMGGKVWAESAFGEGSTFYVSLPRITADEYEKRQIAIKNEEAVRAFQETALNSNILTNAAHISQAQPPVFGQPVAAVGAAPAMMPTQPAQQPVAMPAAPAPMLAPATPVAPEVPQMPPVQVPPQQAASPAPVQANANGI